MGTTVDPTGLSFTVTKIDGTTESVSPQTLTPTTWGDTAGTQTCTFTYSDGYDSVSCEVEATVLAEELTDIAVSGTPSVQTAETSVNATGLTVTATYNSGRTADVTSSAVFTDFVTETGTVGPALTYANSNWGVSQTKVHVSYTEGGITEEADTASVYVISPNGTNDGTTAYSLENAADSYIALDARGFDTTTPVAYPYDGVHGGYLIEGATAGTLAIMYFTKSQWDNDTAVDITAFANLIPATGAKLAGDANSPAYGDVFSVSNQSYTTTISVDGTAAITDPVGVVSVLGYLANAVTAGGEGTIKKSDFVLTGDNAAKTWFVNIVAE